MLVVHVKTSDLYEYVERILAQDGKVLGYRVNTTIAYFSKRYQKYVVCEEGDRSNGADVVKDINSFSWLFHDDLCSSGVFHDGTPCTNWQASMITADILKEEGKWFRRHTWFIGTWLFGGGKARDNGMW